MQGMLGLTDLQRDHLQPIAFSIFSFSRSCFARWVLVMYHFEKAVYADPDQDLNALWLGPGRTV
jgi:peptidyl-dipeptidase A